MASITALTVAELGALLQTKQLSAREVTAAYLASIARQEPAIHAYLTVTASLALEQAGAVDNSRAAGEDLPALAGIPMALKDNLCTKGILTTCASKMLGNFIPPYDAGVVEKLWEQRSVLLGKCNMDEFAMGSTTEHSSYGITHNPCDPAVVPGGSSGGSAAAVAAQEAAFALGTDTGGSVRQPASFCGVVGIKPTYGRISRYGLIAFASSMDQVGVLTKDVRDSAWVLNALVGQDPRDATSAMRSDADFTSKLGQGVRGLKIALPKEFFGQGISAAVKDRVAAAAKRYEQLGAVLVETSLPTLEMALPAYYILSSAQASSNLARFDGVKYGFRAADCATMEELYRKSRSQGFGKEVKRRILLGSFVLSAGYYEAYYQKAVETSALVRADFARIFEDCDVILSPVSPTTAYAIGENEQDPLRMYRGDLCTVGVNIAGLPAISLPCGTDEKGLPIGMQLIGKPFGEVQLYQAAFAFEQAGGVFHG